MHVRGEAGDDDPSLREILGLYLESNGARVTAVPSVRDAMRLINARLEGMRVLAVDDHAEMLESLRQMLEEQGARVKTARSRLEAL